MPMSAEQRHIAILFSDIESSTTLWQQHTDAMKSLIVKHDAIVDGMIVEHGGKVIDHAGDGVFAVFEAGDPLQCALQIQLKLQEEDWGEVGELRIRMGLHAGIALKTGEDYRSPVVNKSARIMSTAWGGQIVFTPELLEKFPLPAGATTDDLGMHQLKDLDAPVQILGLIHPEQNIKEFPALRSLSQHPNNLPLQNTTFIGREQELTQIATHLETSPTRLLTLLGPGGMGKTRLALQAAANAIEKFNHGVFFVNFAAVNEESLVVSTIADALKFNFYAGKDLKDQLLDYLSEKQMLLVIDNMEHLMGTTPILDDILQHATKIQILATSRERLNLSQETLLPLEGLSVSGSSENSTATLLFIERAQQIDTSFLPTDDDLAHIEKICELVGGTPLGIELSAAWVRMLSCEDIVEEIEQELDFLVSSQQNVVDRHRSMRAVFEYSWKLLTEEQRDILKKLSVFKGSWDKNAAKQVAGASLQGLSQLLDKSLLRRSTGNRFFVQEMLRYYAQEKLTADDLQHQTANASHCQYFIELLKAQAIEMKGMNQAEALETIKTDLGNIRAAWNWALENEQVEILDQSLDGLSLYHEKRGQFETGKMVFEQAMKLNLTPSDIAPEMQQHIKGRLRARYGFFLYRIGHYKIAQMAIDQALAVAETLEDAAESAYCLNWLGMVHLSLGKASMAREQLERSLEIRRDLNDTLGIAASLNNLGGLAYASGDFTQSKTLFSESLAIYKMEGDLWSTSVCLSNLGEISRVLGDYADAEAFGRESLELRESFDDRWGIATSFNNLGILAHNKSEWTDAKQLYLKSMELREELGDRWGVSNSQLNLGMVSFQEGNLPEAKSFFEKSLKIRSGLGERQGVATCLAELGHVALKLKSGNEAKQYFQDALSLSIEIEAYPIALQSLLGVAMLWHEDQPGESAKLLNYLNQHPAKTSRIEKQIKEFVDQASIDIGHADEHDPKDTELTTVVHHVLNQLQAS